MVGNLVEDQTQYLQLTRETLHTIYQHTWFLANFRFSRPIEVLQTRNTGYEKEDFVQEVVQQVCKLFETKKFPTINHLKKMIRLTMSYHYLHEKRKYFYTKSRGGIQCTSLEEDINDYRKVEDTVAVDTSYSNESIYDLHRLYSKNLYIAYDWNVAKVITSDQFKDYTNHCIISVNFFINKQREVGMVDTCKFYKDNGYYMTKRTFDYLSQTIIDYLKANDILLIEDIKERTVKPIARMSDEQIHNATYTCTCGYVHYDNDFDNNAWQCPECGRIHNKEELRQYNIGLSTNYHQEEHNVIISNVEELITPHTNDIENTRINLIKQYKKEFDNILEEGDFIPEDLLDTSKELVLA